MNEPLFSEELQRRIHSGHVPVPPPPRQLVKKIAPSFLRKGVSRSTLVHLTLLGLALASTTYHNLFESKSEREAKFREQLNQNSIRVDMVSLPSLKLDDLAKVDASKEVGAEKPAPAEKPAEKAAERKEPPKLSATAMIDRTQEAKVNAEKAKANKKPEKTSALDRLKALRDSLRADSRRKELTQKFKGKEGGRPALGGNIISQGSSTSGNIASEADAYGGKASAFVIRNWNVPAWMSTGKLKASILVKVAPDGRILSHEFLKKSGNEEFDGYVLRAIEASNPLPPPPEDLQRTCMEDGLVWGFPK